MNPGCLEADCRYRREVLWPRRTAGDPVRPQRRTPVGPAETISSSYAGVSLETGEGLGCLPGSSPRLSRPPFAPLLSGGQLTRTYSGLRHPRLRFRRPHARGAPLPGLPHRLRLPYGLVCSALSDSISPDPLSDSISPDPLSDAISPDAASGPPPPSSVRAVAGTRSAARASRTCPVLLLACRWSPSSQ